MATLISNSGGDENRRAHGGQAGDQTGREWSIINWYSSPWNCVLRHPNPTVRAKIAELAKAAAENDKIGYDQHQRNTYWEQLKANNYNPSKITVPCEADCSAGVIANVKAVGFILGDAKLQNVNATYTGNMRAGFKAAGFECLTDRKYVDSGSYLIVGDILLNDSKHTATVIGVSGAVSASANTTSKSEVCTVTLPVLTHGCKGPSVKALQILLIGNGHSCGPDGADGSFGPATKAAVGNYQRANGLTVDFSVGPETWTKLLK